MTAEIIPIRGAEQPTELIEKKTYVGRPERLRTLSHELGFYPHNNDEASRAMGLLGRSETEFPALTYLNEIAIRSRKENANGPSALRAVVHKFDEYAGNALNELTYTENLIESLQEKTPSNFSSFATLFPLEDWKNDGTMKAAFTALTRHIETREFVENEGDDSLGKRHLVDYTMGEERENRIISTLSKVRAGELNRTAEAVRASEENRFSFWVEQLEVSRRHLFARETATIALQSLIEAQRS